MNRRLDRNGTSGWGEREMEYSVILRGVLFVSWSVIKGVMVKNKEDKRSNSLGIKTSSSSKNQSSTCHKYQRSIGHIG